MEVIMNRFILFCFLALSISSSGQNKDEQKLLSACHYGFVDKDFEKIIKRVNGLIHKDGVNINAVDQDNETPLYKSMKPPAFETKFKTDKWTEIVKMLLLNGADPNIQADCFIITHLYRRKNSNYEILVDKEPRNGETPLTLAIRYNQPELFDLLILNNSNIDFIFQPTLTTNTLVKISDLYKASKLHLNDRLLNKQGGCGVVNIHELGLCSSEELSNTTVCIIGTQPNYYQKVTPLKYALLVPGRNYHIIEKLCELSSHELNNDLDELDFVKDYKTIEILKKYKFKISDPFISEETGLQKANSENTNFIYTDLRDGEKYKTVKIGSQLWLAQNLNYEVDRGSWCYNNDKINCSKYGRLYEWETALEVCPKGWRLPSKNDFEILLSNIGRLDTNQYNAMKDGSISGFDAEFGGYRWISGSYYSIGHTGSWWSSSISKTYNAWRLSFNSYFQGVILGKEDNKIGISVRCINDN